MTSGILAQEGAQRVREREAGLFVDVDLVDSGQLNFGGVFGRRDVDARLVQYVQAGVERHRLAGAGRPGHQHHAVRSLHRVQQGFLLVGLIAQRIDPQLGLRGIENPHHDLLAEHRRQGADAEVDGALPGEGELHAAVLRNTLLGDVELGNDLDARRQSLSNRKRRLGDLAQDAIDAEADAIELLVRLEVQIRRAFADGIQQKLLYEANDRCIVDFELRRVVVGSLVRGFAQQVVEVDVIAAGHFLELLAD